MFAQNFCSLKRYSQFFLLVNRKPSADRRKSCCRMHRMCCFATVRGKYTMIQRSAGIPFAQPNWAGGMKMKLQTCNLVRHVGVSENSGTPKSSILIGFSIINHPFWGTPIFGNTHVILSKHEIFQQTFPPVVASGRRGHNTNLFQHRCMARAPRKLKWQ